MKYAETGVECSWVMLCSQLVVVLPSDTFISTEDGWLTVTDPLEIGGYVPNCQYYIGGWDWNQP